MNNCEKRQCNSTLVCRLTLSFIHLFGVAVLRFDTSVMIGVLLLLLRSASASALLLPSLASVSLYVCLSLCLPGSEFT